MNTYTKLIKRGRPRKYESAEQLEKVFEDYVEYIENNPIEDIDYRGKDAVPVILKKIRPLTKPGFAIFAGFSAWEDVKLQSSRDDKFSELITRIETILFAQKFEGACIGAFNANIISRDLGLIDKQHNELTTTEPLLIIRTEKGGD